MDYYDDSINDNVDIVDEINNEENEIILTDCLMRGRGVTSSLWNYFDRLPNDRALCRGYKKDLAGGGKKIGTLSLIRHLNICRKTTKTFEESDVGKLVVDHAGKLRA